MSIIKIIKEKGFTGCVKAVNSKLIIEPYNRALFKKYSADSIDSNSIVLESEGDCSNNAYRLIDKIKKHGIVGSVKLAITHVCRAINHLLYYVFRAVPVNKKLIVLESEGDLTDNAFALYDYMGKNGYLDRYKLVWLVDDVDSARQKVMKNTECVIKFPNTIELKRSYYMATCRWYLYDHNNVLNRLRKRREQTLVYLSHGWGYKASKGADVKRDKSRADYITATGDLSAKGLADYWCEDINKVKITGYPRIDYFFENNRDVEQLIQDRWKFKDYKKVVFWMPTFRKSYNIGISEDYITNQTGLPIFETAESLKRFSEYLAKRDILLVFKLHHLQAELSIFRQKFKNIVIVRDSELYKMGIQLYQMVKLADAVISDYSSIAIDFMVLDRPLVYTLDDYEEYNRSRGLFPPNAIDFMPGYHVYSVADLEESLDEICVHETDKYRSERQAAKKHYHKYLDGDSSKRILELLGIFLDGKET